MKIRKEFKFEGAHIVRNCSTDMCKYSIHGHSYRVEIFLTADELDNGMMVVDFGLLKGTIKEFIESFDHATAFWDKENDEYVNAVIENSKRWISIPGNPSAEFFAIMFFKVIDYMLENTNWRNGETGVKLLSVRVHETATGWAEAFREDLKMKAAQFEIDDIEFSPQVMSDWKTSSVGDVMFHGHDIEQLPTEQQIKEKE